MNQQNPKLIGSIAMAICILIALGIFLGLKTSENVASPGSEEESALNGIDSDNFSEDSESSITAEIDGQSLYAWATDILRVDSNPAFIEARLGPAEIKSPSPYTDKIESLWSFTVQGCPVAYGVTGSSVKFVDALVTEKCHPVVQDMKVTRSTKIREVFEKFGGGQFRANCLRGSCGNAIEPSTDLWIAGAHVGNFIDMAFTLDDSEVDTASWVERIVSLRRNAEDPYQDIGTCTVEPSPRVQQAFMESPIISVMIGRDIPIGPLDCDNY